MEFPGEMDAVRECVKHGEQFGFGNMIDRLKIAWALKLMDHPDFPSGIESAFQAAGLESERATRPGDPSKKMKWMREYIGEKP